MLGGGVGVVGGHAAPHVVGSSITATVGAVLEVNLKKFACLSEAWVRAAEMAEQVGHPARSSAW